jgi:tripartite-type tricarboxylate transporter receptor subunit TctC
MRDATVEAMNTPSLRERMAAIGTDLVAADRTSSSYLQHFVASEIKKWAAPIKESGVTVD